MKKILTNDQVDGWVDRLRSAGRKLGYTCGTFDLLHAGHVDYLARSRGLCDALLVAVNSDWSIREYKNPHRPICPELERMTVVAALASVDAVTILNDVRPLAQIQRWKPDSYIKGGDYSVRQLRSAQAVTEYGGQVITVPVQHLVSTSQIIERILTMERLAPPSPVDSPPPKGIVFLDRDGTLLRDSPYMSDPRNAELLPGVGEGLAELQGAGYRLVIVTNQQGIGLGYFPVSEFIAVNTALFGKLAPYGVTISRIYYCPHSAADACDCRKPLPGLLLRGLREFGVAAERCFMVGDRDVDAMAGASAGCSAVLVGAGGQDGPWPRFSTFAEAAAWILKCGADPLVRSRPPGRLLE
jgi:rfaE bifunctional protein nucleotidyltransferase chain/domain